MCNIIVNSPDKRFKFKELTPGDLDKEIWEAFRNYRYKNKRYFGVLYSLYLLKLLSLFRSCKGKNDLPSLES